MHQSIPAASSAPSSPGYCRAFARLVSPGGGAFANFALPGGWAFANPELDTDAVSYQNIATQRILLQKQRLGHLLRTGKKLRRFVKACSRFYACISSLLIKPELHREIGSYQRESTYFWLLNQFLLILIDR